MMSERLRLLGWNGAAAESPDSMKSGMTAAVLKRTEKIMTDALMRRGWYSRDAQRSFMNRPVIIAAANIHIAADAKRTVPRNDKEFPVPEIMMENRFSSIAETRLNIYMTIAVDTTMTAPVKTLRRSFGRTDVRRGAVIICTGIASAYNPVVKTAKTTEHAKTEDSPEETGPGRLSEVM